MTEQKELELKRCHGLYPELVTDDKYLPFQYRCRYCGRTSEKCVNGLAAVISWNEEDK